MKKFYSLMIVSSLLVSGSAMAKMHTPKIASERPSQTNQSAPQSRVVGNMRVKKINAKAKSPKKVTPIPVGKYGDVIYTAPEGNVENLSRSGESFYVFWGGLYSGPYENIVSEIVTVDNEEVYLKDPISMYGTNAYLKGYKDGDKLIFELPQSIMVDEYYGCDMLVTLLQYADDEDGGWFYPANTEVAKEFNLPDIDNQLVIDINEDGSYSYSADEGVIVGLMYGDDLSWSGYAELKSDWKKFDESPIEAPANLKTEEVAVKHEGVGNFASIGFDGNDVYIKGLFAEMPDAWVKGTRDGDKISFESGQYLGPNYVYNYYTYFSAAKIVPIWDETYEEWYDGFELRDEIVFDFNEEELSLTCSEDDAIICNTSKTEIINLNYCISPEIKRQAEDISKTPADPYNLNFEDDFQDYGYNYFYFNLPQLNVDGDLLNTSDLYYRIYVDGDEYEFFTDDYTGLEEDMTLIPYSFTDPYGDFESSGVSHGIYFYFEGAENLGVQLCYIHDGELLGESEIVTISTDPSSVKTIGDADGKQVKSVRYFNVNGQEISGNQTGFLIKTVRYSDGTQKSIKVIRK